MAGYYIMSALYGDFDVDLLIDNFLYKFVLKGWYA